MSTETLQPAELERLATAALEATGVGHDSAASTAAALLADLRRRAEPGLRPR